MKLDRIDEYKRLHREVWPDVLAELRAAGVRNYMWEEGHEFGVLECDDWSAVQQYLGASAVMEKWETFMSDYLATPVQPGHGLRMLEEVFRLD